MVVIKGVLTHVVYHNIVIFDKYLLERIWVRLNIIINKK